MFKQILESSSNPLEHAHTMNKICARKCIQCYLALRISLFSFRPKELPFTNYEVLIFLSASTGTLRRILLYHEATRKALIEELFKNVAGMLMYFFFNLEEWMWSCSLCRVAHINGEVLLEFQFVVRTVLNSNPVYIGEIFHAWNTVQIRKTTGTQMLLLCSDSFKRALAGST